LTLRGLVRLGYQVDPRLQRALAFTLSESRWDGGYYCSQVTARQDSKSCIRGSKNVLLLFSELPEVWETPQCRLLVDYSWSARYSSLA
jgi:hypothetical protein